MLLCDEQRRQGGLDDEEYEELGVALQEQRAELARMLAQGRTAPILPALRSFLHLCGINDKGPGEREIMEENENRALAILPEECR